MNRITQRRKDGFYDLINPNYGEENGIRLAQIVGKFEDLIQAYEEGIWAKEDEYSKVKFYDVRGFTPDKITIIPVSCAPECDCDVNYDDHGVTWWFRGER